MLFCKAITRQLLKATTTIKIYRENRTMNTHLRKQSKIGYNTMGNVVIEGNS